MERNLIEIKDSELTKYLSDCYGMLRSTTFSSQKKTEGRSFSTAQAFGGSVSGPSAKFSIEETLNSLSDESKLLSKAQHSLMHTLQQGLALCTFVLKAFERSTPLERLKEEHMNRVLEGDAKIQYKELRATSSYAGVFTFANYVQSTLEDSTAGLPPLACEHEVSLGNPIELCNSFLYGLNNLIIEKNPSDAELHPLVKAYALSYIEALRLHESSLRYAEAFTGVQYRTEMWDFEISGFDLTGGTKKQMLPMIFKKPEEVVGNRIAKYQMKRLAKMMMCYDFHARKNPFVEMGGFIFTFMGDGNPGTGKTTLIQMLCGLLNDYCQIAGYPFYYENFSADQIDSYQGKSGQNAKNFIRNVTNPDAICFGTIDDIDQIAGKRGDKSSSAGQQEVTAILMESLAGANTIVRGNCTIGMFSNFPENVDDALRQRAAARYVIDGPKTKEDFADLLSLLLSSRADIGDGKATLFETQAIEGAIQKTYSQHNEPQTEALRKVYEGFIKENGEITTFEDFGAYMDAIQKVEPRFTGRAAKNIADAAKTRAADFDLPDEWFENPEVFLHQPYDKKVEMISGFFKKVTPEMLLQELHRYADSEFRYSGNSDEAAIKSEVRSISIRQEALKRYTNEAEEGGDSE